MSYNTRVIREPGGSKLRVASGGSYEVESGGQATFADGAIKLGNTVINFGTDIPTATASPGAVYFRSDGSISNIYVNVSDGATGSVWKGASLFTA